MVRAELWGRYEGRCARCGEPLGGNNFFIDHIFPRVYGGSDGIENLRLLCRRCNMVLTGHLRLNKTEFQQYLQRLLCHDCRFENVRTDVQIEILHGQKTVFDIMFSRTLDGREEQFIVEVKSKTEATAYGTESVIRELDSYQHLYPDAHYILAVPTRIAEEYRQRVRAAGFTLWDSEVLRLGIPDIALPVCSVPDQYDVLLSKLKQCPPGYEHWRVYQRLVGEILTALFCPPLDPISEENADNDYANRRDFILPNYSNDGYWPYLRNRYGAEFIVVDAKNSACTVGKDDILQVAHYLKAKGAGLLGLIFSRFGVEERVEAHLRDIWQQEEKLIVVLSIVT